MDSFDEAKAKVDFQNFFEKLTSTLPKDSSSNENSINDVVLQLASKGMELTLRKNYTSSVCSGNFEELI